MIKLKFWKKPFHPEIPRQASLEDAMKIVYDPDVDALSIIFRETTVTSKDLGEGITADYDSDGKLAGIEVLDASKRFGGHETFQSVLIEGVGLSA